MSHALGPIGQPIGYVSNRGFKSMTAEEALILLAQRLAPPEIFQKITMNNLAAGAALETVKVNRPYNGMLVSLTAGEVDLFFGSAVSAVHDLHFGPSLNPVPVYFSPRKDNQLTVVCNADSSNPAYGSIFLMSY